MFGFVAASGWVTAQVEICAGLVWIFVCLDARITWSLLACTARRVPRPGGAPANPRGGALASLIAFGSSPSTTRQSVELHVSGIFAKHVIQDDREIDLHGLFLGCKECVTALESAWYEGAVK